MSDNIKVVVKVRPLIRREIEEKLSYQWRVQNNTLYQLDHQGRDFGQVFTFDQVYDQDTKTSDVYNDIAKPIVEAATAGFNGTIFAYGQTSSGKTYTMTGTEDAPGIIPLAILNLFEIIKNIPDRDFLVRVSYMEIYNETLKDLLDVKKDNLKIHETLQGIKVQDTTEKMTSSPEEVLDIMKQGEANRQTGSTNMNETSSRSHSIFQITIESREHVSGSEQAGCVNVSQLNLVDLAGSERAGQTGATGLRFREGTHINKSLSALALVIKQLSEGPNKYANYRDSKLTRLLQNSLGGNAKTSIVCAVTPAAVEETISTLQFANRAKAIKNKPEVNAVATDATMIQRLTKQLSKLQMQLEKKKNLEMMLESKKNIEQDNYNLQKQIVALQRLFLNGFGAPVEGRPTGRKPPPRRVTISTLHAIEDDPPPQKQKFCTPLLKYNPMLLPSASDFVPIQNKLPSLPEESGLVTPPPNDKKVNFNDEVIDLDSDDDCKDSCSPYHKCFSHSKTPPCILRKNAKQAERNFKDIVELTEREKMYTPNVIELMEKIEQNTNEIARLQDEVDSLSKESHDKDNQLHQLKYQITLTEHEVKQINLKKLELETQCKDYNTKLTDWEVIHETLKNKAKLREEELLSLLDEKKVFSGKPKNLENELTHFMDMSKDISLVNSDNESSITYTNEDVTPPLVQDIVTDLQAQLTMKTQIVIELEANLFAHEQKIATIENTTRELNSIVSNLQDKLQLYENENSLLKSTVDNLNSTIKAQKSSLEVANNDIESYNNVIEELQIKLTQKESLINLDINESVIETMIANEDQFIANNENMKNIIHSFKVPLDTRNKEITELKSTIEENTDRLLDSNNLKDQLEDHAKLVNTLNAEVETLKLKLDGNVTTINMLMQDKSNLEDIERELTAKLTESEEKNKALEEMNKEKEVLLLNLKENNDNLISSIANIKEKEFEIVCLNEDLSKKVVDAMNIIANLEKEIGNKEKTIEYHSQKEEETEANVQKAMSSINKLQVILNILSGDIQECPNVIENIVSMLNTLCDRLDTLETIAKEVVSDKDSALKNNAVLKDELSTLSDKYDVDVKNLQSQINHLTNIANNKQENESLLNKITNLTSELQNLQSDLSIKNNEIDCMKQGLKEMKESNEGLHKDVVLKENIITTLKENDCKHRLEIERILEERNKKYLQFESDIQNLQFDLKSKENIYNEDLDNKESKIKELTISLSEIDTKLQEKLSQLKTTSDKINTALTERDEHMKNILQEVSQITLDCCIENSFSFEFENVNINIYEQIRHTLGKIVNHIIYLKSKNKESDSSVLNILSEAKEEIKQLTEKNLKLMNEYTKLENTNQDMLLLIEKIQSDNQNLKHNLLENNYVMEQLKQEFDIKTKEKENMEKEASDFKDQFVLKDQLMQQQFEDIKLENVRLKERCFELGKDSYHRCEQLNDTQTSETEQSDSEGRFLSNSLQAIEMNSPPSLLTICCNKIIDYIEPCDSKSLSPAISSASIEKRNMESQIDICQCRQLSLELAKSKEEKSKLLHVLDEMQLVHQQLLHEQEEVRKEVAMLLEPATELQKKIANHKTNLSILTATTYTENKSLHSQVTALQHHHNRFHNVCQRDIPDFKNKLRELLSILNSDPTLSSAHNVSFKRYSLPDVLDNNSTISNLKNESTLDGDLLMLDTNITLMSNDNTLIGHEQTCLDLTQVMSNEVGCQTNESHKQTESEELHPSQTDDMLQELRALQIDNLYLREQVEKYTEKSQVPKNDAQNSPIKFDYSYTESKDSVCEVCRVPQNNFRSLHDSLVKELDLLSKELSDVKTLKEEMEEKYKNLQLEIPSTDAIVKKLSTLEVEYNMKVQENTKLTNTLNNKLKDLKQLQEENDTLSTQVMENISEADDLNKELDKLKELNKELNGKCESLEKLVGSQKDSSIDTRTWSCSQCSLKDDLMHSLPAGEGKNIESHSKLNRSYSDSDTSSRHNKICTLQSELHAGREDCKELTEEVATIKNHLERSNLSMDLDESMGDTSIYANKCSMPDIPEETSDTYIADKIECLNYYVEKANVDRKDLNCDIKMVDILKMLYNDLIIKHGNEVENLVNKLKDFEESKTELQAQVDKMTQDYHNTKKELRENIKSITNFVSEIKNKSKVLTEDIANNSNADKTSKLVNVFKENVLNILDFEFGLSSVHIFDYLIENIISRHQKELGKMLVRYSELQKHMEILNTELTCVNENLVHVKLQLSEKEKEFDLMKAQKERVHEISNAVTLDIVRKEEELNKLIVEGCQKLLELNIMNITNVDFSLPLNTNINFLFEYLSNRTPNSLENDEERTNFIHELANLKAAIDEKDKLSDEAKTRNDRLHEINQTVTLDLIEKDKQFNNLNTLYEDLMEIYNIKVEENEANQKLTQNLNEEITMLKENGHNKDLKLKKLEDELDVLKYKREPEKDHQIAELNDIIRNLREEIVNIKTANDMILKEKQEYASELEKSSQTIKANAEELDKMNSDILILKESVREGTLVVENLKLEASSLLKQNEDLKHRFEKKTHDCSRLDINIRTHEKTAEIQSRMIMRLQKQREEDDVRIKEKEEIIQQLTEKCSNLQGDYETLQATIKTHRDEIDVLTTAKQSLEVRIAELLSDMEISHQPRPSLETKADSSRRRRQSLYDSKRFFDEEFKDQNNVEAVFEARSKPDDLFMDVDDDTSNRSTPIRLSRGRDSMLSRTNQSDKDEDQPSRPSSVLAARKRRQSAHDLHRSIIRHTPSPRENSLRLVDEPNHLQSEPFSTLSGDSSEVSQLKNKLSSCQIELEELRERYRELDDECETCAQYLRERDQQCGRLKKEKIMLENTVKELREKLQLMNTDVSLNGDSRKSVAHVSVNTDEDWANLHAVVVDRMSYDAEVEKNKRLTKTMDELRFKKQELKNTIAKMQKALDKCSGKDNRELETTKQELESCREELSELRQRYKELDEECETCAQYLQERDQQCRRLKEAKAVLEMKLQELQEDVSLRDSVQSARKKRQSTHDQNRSTSVDLIDATTETSEDFLSYQVEKDYSKQIAEDTHAKEIKRLRMTIEKLSHQKTSLEQQLMTTTAAAAAPVYVATGSAIVQHQQLSDVMKENQKLKKMNAKLVNFCKKRGKEDNSDISEQS